MRGLRIAILSLIGLAPALPALALDCSQPMTQRDMNQCAQLAYEAADRDLNAAYQVAMARAKSWDMADTRGPRAADNLRDAQRSWISFRDAACLAESLRYRGGSMQGMEYSRCLEKLTRRRTDDLNYLGAEY